MDSRTTRQVDLISAETEEQIGEARSSFREYEMWLGLDLCFQGFEAELAGLPGDYTPPDGSLFLAYVDQAPAGCVALRRIGKDSAEMKRLFVRNEFRGLGVGLRLIEKLLETAKARGYRFLRLDTFPPRMGKAVDMYRSLGFTEIEPYYDNPHSGTIFMELRLGKDS